MTIKPTDFYKKTGRLPVQDDLQRVNCKDAGKIGHWSCGWCEKHDKPMFECMCRTRKELAP